MNIYSGNFQYYKFCNKGDSNYEIKDSTGSTDNIKGLQRLTFADNTTGVSAIVVIKGVFDQVTGIIQTMVKCLGSITLLLQGSLILLDSNIGLINTAQELKIQKL